LYGRAYVGLVATRDPAGRVIRQTYHAASDQPLGANGHVLGRVASRAVHGVALSLTYDTLGRVTQEVNVLGTFTYGYDGVSGRLASATYPNGQTSAYGYRPALEDHRLQTIHHRLADLTTLSRFDYTYDGVGNILTWQQQAGAAAAVRGRDGYDRADQLTGAVRETTDPTPQVLHGSPTGLTRRAIVCSSRSTTP
jgi:YD repeat-containing protein